VVFIIFDFLPQAISLSDEGNNERFSAEAHLGSKVVGMVTVSLYAPPTAAIQESSCFSQVSTTLLFIN
jgi:hypothetical protein